MTREQIKHITNSHYQRLRKYSKLIPENFEGETIHRFRVEYKKLRAFLRMLSQSGQIEAKIKVSKNLKKVYRLAGSIRDLQLQQQRVRNAAKDDPKKPRSYLHLLEKEINNIKPDLKAMVGNKMITESKKKTNATLPETFSLVDFRRSVQKKRKSIDAIIKAGDFSDNAIHAIRKDLKDLFYNLNTLYKIEHNLSQQTRWIGKEKPYYDRLLDELGKFQDSCASVALLKPRWLAKLNTRNQELLEELKKEWINEKSSRKKGLMQQLKTTLPGKI
ncbi:MAG TPA: CHAD domain-containing protein [Agriterribacter sp.]|nr:CHAD domain-containing protein [Agriterribacter sp.]